MREIDPEMIDADIIDEPITTNDNYWDCSCESGYIHVKAKPECIRCGAFEADMPPARVNEMDIPENLCGCVTDEKEQTK